MFGDEGLEALGSLLLTLFFIKHVIVVFDYFFYGAPVLLHHLGHVLRTFFQFMFDIFLFPLFFEFFLMELFFTSSAIFFCITHFFFSFTFEILSHPFHFLDKEIPMGLGLWLLEVFGWVNLYRGS
jgi:hypothetical protein